MLLKCNWLALGEMMELLNVALEETEDYVAQNPSETKETFDQRRKELQEVATPVVDYLTQLSAEIDAKAEKAGNGETDSDEEETEEADDEDKERDDL